MRKSTKALLTIGALIAAPIVVNHLIAKKAKERIEKNERSKPSENVYSWDYGDIHYTTAGEGPPLLLLHGIYPGASNLEWENVLAGLSENYKVYVPDMLGFGYSDKPALDYSGYLYVRLIKDFCENVIGSPVTAAASLHSAAALVTCAALNPEDFKKVLLVSPTGLENNVPLAQDEDSYMKKALESPIFGTSVYNALVSKKALSAFYEREGLAYHLDDETLDKIYLAAHAYGASGKYALASLFAKFFNADVGITFETLEMPHHIILGDCKPGQIGFHVWSGISEDHSATVIEDCGLLPHVENPEDFLRIAKEYL